MSGTLKSRLSQAQSWGHRGSCERDSRLTSKQPEQGREGYMQSGIGRNGEESVEGEGWDRTGKRG